jgi:hypothetical protein
LRGSTSRRSDAIFNTHLTLASSFPGTRPILLRTAVGHPANNLVVILLRPSRRGFRFWFRILGIDLELVHQEREKKGKQNAWIAHSSVPWWLCCVGVDSGYLGKGARDAWLPDGLAWWVGWAGCCGYPWIYFFGFLLFLWATFCFGFWGVGRDRRETVVYGMVFAVNVVILTWSYSTNASGVVWNI